MNAEMEVNMPMACEEVTVHTMNTFSESGPAFYASLPCGQYNNSHCSEDEDRHHLISALWDHLAATEHPLWKELHTEALPIRLTRSELGRPQLMLSEHNGPAISFSECGGKVWAALCGDESDIGIDAAEAAEFRGSYPFHRVFHPQELQHALHLTNGNTEQASALLWSVKEAVVKALGCAFNLVEPLQIAVNPAIARTDEKLSAYNFRVSLSGKALMRYPLAADGYIRVSSLLEDNIWLSIALLDRRTAGNE
jgi:phosphopantetheinyl transferase